MRYSKDHREKTRQRIVETASQILRRDGIVASGVVGLMSEAGLTQGGFYAHFDSKDALVNEAVRYAQDGARGWLSEIAVASHAEGVDPIDGMIDAYLSMRHLNALPRGCTLAALGAELGRQNEAIRRTSFTGMTEVMGLLAQHMPSDRRSFAPALYNMLAGTLQFARLAATDAEQEAILISARVAARELTRSSM